MASPVTVRKAMVTYRMGSRKAVNTNCPDPSPCRVALKLEDMVSLVWVYEYVWWVVCKLLCWWVGRSSERRKKRTKYHRQTKVEGRQAHPTFTKVGCRTNNMFTNCNQSKSQITKVTGVRKPKKRERMKEKQKTKKKRKIDHSKQDETDHKQRIEMPVGETSNAVEY